MSTWAPNTKGVRPYASKPPKSRNGKAVTGLIAHIGANAPGTTVLGYVSSYNDRNSHPTYVIKANGEVWGVVHPNQRPTSTYPGDIDEQCVTVELDNTTGAPDYQVSQAQLDSLAVLIRHHADESPRRGKTIVKNDPNKTQDGFFLGWHSQYRNVTCPGPFLFSKFDEVLTKANGKKTSAPVKTPVTPAPAIPAAPSSPNVRRTLKQGSKGADVGRLQKFLKENYPSYAGHIVVDNDFGSQTAKVVASWQRRSGLVADGIVGLRQTWPALIRAGLKG